MNTNKLILINRVKKWLGKKVFSERLEIEIESASIKAIEDTLTKLQKVSLNTIHNRQAYAYYVLINSKKLYPEVNKITKINTDYINSFENYEDEECQLDELYYAYYECLGKYEEEKYDLAEEYGFYNDVDTWDIKDNSADTYLETTNTIYTYNLYDIIDSASDY